MARRILYTRRLLQCQAVEGPCGICTRFVTTNLFDADLLSRVCLGCGEDSGIAEIVLSKAGIAQPDEVLIQQNP